MKLTMSVPDMFGEEHIVSVDDNSIRWDADMSDLYDLFRRLLLAMTFSEQTIDEFFNDEDESDFCDESDICNTST